jgi:hypothetical protein
MTAMSFVHYSIVGYFDPSDLASFSPSSAPIPIRSLDADRVASLVASCAEDIARWVEVRAGCAWCEWSADRSGRVYRFAERLADAEAAFVVESPLHVVRYPPEAKRAFEAAISAWKAGPAPA